MIPLDEFLWKYLGWLKPIPEPFKMIIFLPIVIIGFVPLVIYSFVLFIKRKIKSEGEKI